MIDEAIVSRLYSHGYKCHRKIGSGSYGNIFLVESVKYKEFFVAKMIIIDENKPRANAALEEVKMLMLINHPNIINMYETFIESFDSNVIAKMMNEKIVKNKNNAKDEKTDEGSLHNGLRPELNKNIKMKNVDHYEVLFIVLEYCSGGSLRDFINRYNRDPLGDIDFKNHLLSGKMLLSYSKQIAQAIQKCHRSKIAHQDIKPENILFDRYGRVKLADFGLSHISNPDDNTAKRGGSPLYMAPELYKKEPFDALKTDIWSFGITLFELAFGHTPFNSNEMRKAAKYFCGTIEYPSLSEGPANSAFVKLLRRMINPLPRKRLTIDQVLESEFFAEQNNPILINFPMVKRASEIPQITKNLHIHKKMKMHPSYTTGIRCEDISAKSPNSSTLNVNTKINTNDEITENNNNMFMRNNSNVSLNSLGKPGDGQNPLAFQLKRPNLKLLNRRASLQPPPLTFISDDVTNQ